MYLLFLKIAGRYLLKNKLYSFINVFGLSIGIASFIFIMMYVNYELSYDKFDNSENVYRVYMDYMQGETYEPGDAQTYNISGSTLKQVFPEIEEQVRIFRLGQVTFIEDGKSIQDFTGSMADETYFDVFDYPMILGNKEEALAEPSSIILTESLANKLYGNINVVGKTLTMYYDWQEITLQVTGVMQDFPETVHMKTSYLLSLSTLNTWGTYGKEKMEPNWNQNVFYTFLRIADNTDIDALQQKIIKDNSHDDLGERHNIEALESIHLHSNKPYEVEANGSAARVNFLIAIALIILVLSWLNYVNLSTAKSLERAKEIGIRKVAGAHRPQLILQSNLESLLLNIVALLIALLLVSGLQEPFNNYVGKELILGWGGLIKMLPYIGLVILGTFIAGLYPAVLLSRYQPARVLKGKLATSSQGYTIRKGLIVFQFLTTIVLLIGTITVSKQISFLREQPTGIDLNQVVALTGAMVSDKPDSLAILDYDTFKEEVAQLSFVESSALCSTFPGDIFDNLSSFVGITYPNGVKNENNVHYNYSIDHNYLDVVGIKLLAGESFKETATGRSSDIIINDMLAKTMGFSKPEEAINEVASFWGGERKIIGVIENYYHFGSKNDVLNMVLMQRNQRINILVKLNAGSNSFSGFQSSIETIEKLWKEFFPQSVFSYKMLDSNFEMQYEEDEKFGTAFRIFTILAILIAFLGLFGLTSYASIQRKKEIGVRKVNGATILEILILLNKDFLKSVGIAFLIAIPISWYIMNEWLKGFAIQTELNWWIFAFAGIIAFAIAVLTVSYQSYIAASKNPVDSLRYE